MSPKDAKQAELEVSVRELAVKHASAVTPTIAYKLPVAFRSMAVSTYTLDDVIKAFEEGYWLHARASWGDR